MIIFIYLALTIPICYILTREIYSIYKDIILSNINTNNNYKIFVEKQDILRLAQVHLKRKKWLSCILIIEKFTNNNKRIELYNCLGFCYLSTDFYNTAEYYYDKTLKIHPLNTIALHNLMNIYKSKKINKQIKSKKILQQIKLIEEKNA
uniref:Ycf37 n=1 Tax=Pterocladia lucida TaxID=31408 RepID=A0A6M3WWM2_PTELU|nr:Ycf37 [Pterocladia lucida]